jgi:transposase-like protein
LISGEHYTLTFENAVVEVFGGKALIQRCREHKKRNVSEALPERLRASMRTAMNQAYATRDAKRTRRLLDNLARRLEDQHPGAAASLREGLDETLTVMRFGTTRKPRTSTVIYQPD